MQLTIVREARAFDSVAAWKIIGTILRNGDGRTTLQLGTGSIALGIYRAMAQIHAAHPFWTERVCVFGFGEVAGLARTCLESRYHILQQAVVEPLGIYEENFMMPRPFPDDPSRESRAHESIIDARGGIDLSLLELGPDGSVDLLRPGTPFGSTAFAAQTDGGQTGMTLGIQNIMHSRKLLLAVRGAGQAALLQKVLQGRVGQETPASVLRLHPCLEIVSDQAAASLLGQT